MLRNLRSFALVLASLLALSGVAASAAMAEEGELTADEYPAILSGGPIPGQENTFTALGQTLECEEIFGEGEITGPSTEGTVSMSFGGCSSGARAVTGTANGCSLRVHSPEGEGDEWMGKGDLTCPGTNKVEIHIYNGPGHTNTWCTMTFAPQANLQGLVAVNVTGENPSEDTGRVEGTVTGIAGQTHGTCSAGLTINFNSALHVNASISATNSEEEPIGIRID